MGFPWRVHRTPNASPTHRSSIVNNAFISVCSTFVMTLFYFVMTHCYFYTLHRQVGVQSTVFNFEFTLLVIFNHSLFCHTLTVVSQLKFIFISFSLSISCHESFAQFFRSDYHPIPTSSRSLSIRSDRHTRT